MVLADKILERMADRKIGTASAVKACNALVGGRPGYLSPKSAMYNWIPFVYLFAPVRRSTSFTSISVILETSSTCSPVS